MKNDFFKLNGFTPVESLREFELEEGDENLKFLPSKPSDLKGETSLTIVPRKKIRTVSSDLKREIEQLHQCFPSQKLERLANLADECFQDKFLCYQVEGAGVVIYKVTDLDKREVKLCSSDHELKRILISECKKLGSVISPRDARQAIEYWSLNCTPIEEAPSAFGLPGETNWTFKRVTVEPQEGPTPAWNEFLDRVSDSEDFLAFIGSILDPRHKGRQALYLHGPNGQDGKSCVIRAIESLLGEENVAALNNIGLKNQSQFLTSTVEGKRLAVYPDCKNTKFLMTEVFRSIVSGDRVPVERKGKDAVMKKLYCRVIIASNHRPELTSGGADLSRLILIDVKASKTKNDPLWEDRLIAEMPQLLHKANTAYAKKCPNRGDIKLSDETSKLNRQAADEFEERWGGVFETYLEECPGNELPAGDMKSKVYDREGLSAQDISKFKEFLNNKGFTYKTVKNQRVYVGLKLNPRDPY